MPLPYRPLSLTIRPTGHSPRDRPQSAEVFRPRGFRSAPQSAPGIPVTPAKPFALTKPPGIVHISASQLKTASLCMRKWWFEKLAGVRPGAKYHFHFGKVLHGYLERYQLRQPLEPAGWDIGLQEGHADWVKERAAESIRKGLVRAVTRDVHIEYQLSALIGERWVDARGMPLLGVARAKITPGGERHALPPEQFYNHDEPGEAQLIPKEAFEFGYFTGFMDGLDLTPEHPGVFDHKTAKNRTYAKSPAKLVVDEQMLSYAAVLLGMPGFEQQQEVYLRHNVFLKDPEVSLEKGVYGVDASVTVEAVAEHWRWVIATAKDMKRWRGVPVGIGVNRADAYEQVPSALQVMGYDKGKKEACECYGGCPYKAACLGYKKIQPVVAELDYEVKRVDVYGNDPNKKPIAAVAPKVFTLNKKLPPMAPEGARALEQADSNKNNSCAGVTYAYSKSPTEQATPKDQSMPFLKPAAAQANYTPPLTIGSYAWVDDPDSTNKAFRCNVRTIRGEGDAKEADVYIYQDCNNPTPMTVAMAANVDYMGTAVPWAAISAVLKPGRAGYAFYVAPTTAVAAPVPVGEAIPGTPIPTAGPVSLNTPNAEAVLAASTAKVEPVATAGIGPNLQSPAETPALAKRPAGRPRMARPVVTQPAAGTLTVTEPAAQAEQLPEGARQTTLDEAQAAGEAQHAPVTSEALANIGIMLERAALQGVKAYIDARLKQLGA